MGFRMASRRFTISAAVSLCTLATLTSAPAGAQPEPPPPVIPGYPVPHAIVPGNPGKPYFMQDFSQEFAPYTPPAQTDARGVFVATNANSGQTVVGMPGSRLGIVSPRIGLSPYGITANTGTSLESAGVRVATMGSTAGLEDPNGQPPTSPGPAGLPLLPPPQPNP